MGTIREQYDCAVIGAGPGGATAAALVARAGWRTLLLDRERFPRLHVGESLMPDTYWTLQRLGVWEKMRSAAFRPKIGVQFVQPDGRESQPFFFAQHDSRPCSQTWHVERAVFDHLLYEHAGECGAECHDGTRVLSVDLAKEGPHLVRLHREGQLKKVLARVVVDATGQKALLANRLGLREPNPEFRKAAIWGHFRGARHELEGQPDITTIFHTEDKRAWFWFIPLSRGTVSVGLVGDIDDLFGEQARPLSQLPEQRFFAEIDRCPGIAERLLNARLAGSLRVDKEFSYTTRKHAGDGWVLVGDAYGFIDPTYSTGVMLALRSGELAADAIVEGLARGDTSARQLGSWTADFDAGVMRFRQLVRAFYTPTFSFAQFLHRFPQHRGPLTDLLFGRGFTSTTDAIVADLSPFLLPHTSVGKEIP